MKPPKKKAPFWNPYLGGIALGTLLFLAFLLTGNGLGASGGVARVDAFLEKLIAPHHVDVTPGVATLAGGTRNALDHWVVLVIAGLMIGGFVSGWLRGRVKLETFRGPHIGNAQRWFLAFVGGGLMGFGARVARGCTSGQALSGGAVLSVGSWAFMFAMFAGAYGLAWFLRRVWN